METMLKWIFFIGIIVYLLPKKIKARQGEEYLGTIVDVNFFARNLVVEFEYKGEKKRVTSVEESIFFSKKYIGRKIRIYYNDELPTRCSIVKDGSFKLRDIAED